MKQLLFTLLIVFSGNIIFGQSTIPDKKWFLGVSLEDDPKNIQDQLNTDPRILEISKMEIVSDSGKTAYIFLGKTKIPITLNSYVPDSASIFLTSGKSSADDALKYNGYLKKLQAEYFFSNAADAKKIYDIVYKELKKQSRRKQRFEMIVDSNEKKGEALCITYVETKKQFKEFRIWNTVDIKTKVHSLLFEETQSY